MSFQSFHDSIIQTNRIGSRRNLPELFSYSQNWTRKHLIKNGDSLFTVYALEEHDQFHGAGGEIAITKKGRFNFFEYYPLKCQ